MKPRTLLLALFLLAACGTNREQQSVHGPTSVEPALPSLSDPLPMDPGLTIGTLDNGLTYFIEPNAQPRARAVLRLVIKAGSVLEDEDQIGLAHFVEHMAFNGTRRFPANELVRRLESFGLRFGAHLNAHTGFDETVYELQIPTDDPALLEQALSVLADWAQDVTFDPDEIERERGVAIEEWRQTRGAGGRTRDKLIPLTFHDSLYKDRLPIGTGESLTGFTREALIRFYRDWYRPNLMAIIAVGDFEPLAVEQAIGRLFSPLQNPIPERERIYPPIPDHEQTLYGIVADPEIPATGLSVMLKADDIEGNTHGAYRRFMVENLVTLMLNERFSDLARQPDPPFLGAGIGKQRLTPTEGAFVIGAGTKEGEVARSLEAVLTEIERARRHGFTTAELARAKAKQTLILETYHTERTTTESSTHAEEIIRHFTTGEPMPGIEYEYQLGQRFLPEIGVAEVNAWAKERLSATSRVITVAMPAKAGLQVPSEQDLSAVLDTVTAKVILPPAAEAAVGSLAGDLPPPGNIASEKTSKELGTTEWRLQNGLTVVLKPTDYRTDNLVFAGYAWGGYSLAPDDDYVAAATAAELVGRSGLGAHDAGQLSKMLAGRKAGAMPWVTEIQQGLRGSASPDDLELAFQLIYLIMTAPRFDETAFALAKEGRRQSLLNRLVTPSAVFTDAYTALLWQDHPRYRPWTVETLEQMDREKSAAFFRERFANPGDFTFIFVGSFAQEQIRPLVQQYLGALPAYDRAPTRPVDFGARRISGVHQREVHAGLDANSQVRLTFHGAFSDTRQNRYAIHSLAEVLEVLLREELREALGGTYSVGVSVSIQEAPVSHYELGIGFGCDPARLEELIDSTRLVIAQVRAAPVPPGYIETLQQQQRRAHETELRDNGFWLGALASAYRRGEPPEAILSYDELVGSLTPELVHAAAVKYIDLEQQILVTLKPEASPP